MDEEAFLNSIDCCFPYEDEHKWRKLILQGKSISDNASFGVLYEIARKPLGSKVNEHQQLEMVTCWQAENEHPLVECIIEAAMAIIVNEPLPIAMILGYMDKVQDYRNQYGALSILYFACDDVDGLADEKWQNIVSSWRE
ncbi:MAG: hypothetical protein H6668_17025 [Ardenticatenaceae bacterium]|nr:hypothetical protein [Ardenticatenaceae bacterium]